MGAPVLNPLLATQDAPILATQEVDECTIETPLEQSLLVNTAGVGQSLFTIRTLVPNLDVTMTTFAHGTSFRGQTKLRTGTPGTHYFGLGSRLSACPLISY